MNISQQQIAYILSLIEYKNFGKAAEACFVTQPTLSMQIKKAEESLSQKIFNRNRNPLELTAFGEKLIPILYDMQAEYEKIKRLANVEQGKMVEVIKIGVIPTVASYLVPELFQNQSLFNTGIKLAITEIKSEDLLEQLHGRKIDFAIMAGPIEQTNLKITSLYNEEILIYTSQAKNNDKIHVDELKKLKPWLLNGGNCLRTQMIQFCNLNDSSDQDWNYEGGNLEMLIQMVDEYGGYTLIPAFYADKYKLNPNKLHQLYADDTNKFPARNIISLSSLKNSEHEVLKTLQKFIKISYANLALKNLEILSWK